MRNSSRNKLPWLITGVLLLASWIAYTQRYNAYDWWRLRGYVPPAEIVKLADDTAMTDYGRRLFYVNHPLLNDKSSFQQNCVINEVTIVLGCYIAGDGIFVYKVSDSRLEGVHQVTSAHEMLHAAYGRLSSREKARIDAQIATAFANITDERIKNTVSSYRQRDASVVPNELHSILATEVSILPPELEAYYAKYFKNRATIVNYSKQYEAAFEDRRNKVAEYDAQLSTLKQQIDASQNDLNATAQEISSERAELDALLTANNVGAYNAKVPGFNTKVRNYNALVNKVRSLIDQYNAIVKSRNAIALEENELLQAIDSRPNTLPAH